MGSELKKRFLGLDREAKTRFLALTLNSLTITARYLFKRIDQNQTGDGTEKLRKLNEVTHVLSAKLLGYLEGDAGQYPDGVIVDIVVGRAGDEFSEEVLGAMKFAIDELEHGSRRLPA